MRGKQLGMYRAILVEDFRKGEEYGHVLDIDPVSLAGGFIFGCDLG